MHDLARCAIAAGDRVLDGYVAACADGTMTVGAGPGSSIGALRVGDDVRVLVHDEVRGKVRYDGRLTRVGATTAQVTGLELTSMPQRREVARVSVAQICGGVVSSPDGATRSITFAVVDIGANGMRICTAAVLTELDRVAFQFPTNDRAVPLMAEVLRSQQTGSGSTQYGCRFVGLDERDAGALSRYVLQMQSALGRSRLRS